MTVTERSATSRYYCLMPVHNIRDFVRCLIAATDYCGWDFIKIMTNGNFMPEAYGADLAPSRDPHQWCATFHRYPVESLEDLKALRVLDAKSAPLHREVQIVHALREHYGQTMPLVATIFSPLTSLQEMMSSLDPTGVKQLMAEQPEAVHAALRILTQTICNYLDELIDAGNDGIFFANQFSMSSIISRETFEIFCRPYDLEVLRHIEGRTWLNMIHAHGDADLMMDCYLDYPVQSINWEIVPLPSAAPSGPRLRKSVQKPANWSSPASIRPKTFIILKMTGKPSRQSCAAVSTLYARLLAAIDLFLRPVVLCRSTSILTRLR